MSIISFSFIAFIAVLCIIYYLVSKRFQWVILLLASCVFYVSGGWQTFYYIVLTIISQYILGILLEKQSILFRKEVEEKQLKGKEKTLCKKKYQNVKKKYVTASVLINIGLLSYVKYGMYLIEIIEDVLRPETAWNLNILMPLGISFYTFKSLTYVIDVYRGKINAEHNIFKLALYISYFPSIIQGPIDRYVDIAAQFYEAHSFEYQRFMFAIQRILWGYMKKLIVAERIALIVNEIFGNYIAKGYEGCAIFLGALLYGFQMYADFSGGMDIVIGVSEMLGVQLTENFRRPYLAKSVAEFWQRWHITLGAWMKNYLFYPLSLSNTFGKLGKACRKRFGEKLGIVMAPSLASFLVFILVGVWHGVGWKYVVYGVYHAVLVSTHTLFDDLYSRMRARLKINAQSWGWQLFQILRTVFLISFGRIITRAVDIKEALYLMKLMFSKLNFWIFFDGSIYNMGLNEANFRFMIISIIVVMAIDILQERGVKMRETIAKQNIVFRWCIYFAALAALMIFGMYGPGFDASGFIYQRF